MRTRELFALLESSVIAGSTRNPRFDEMLSQAQHDVVRGDIAQHDASEPKYTTDFVNIGGKKWARWNIGATTEATTYKTCFGDYYQWGSLYRFYTDIYFGYDQNPYWEQQKQNYITYLGWTKAQIQEYLKTPSITFNFKPERKKGFAPEYVNFQDHNVYEPEDIVQRIMKDVEGDEGEWRMPTPEDFNDLIMDCYNEDVPSSGLFRTPPLNSDNPGKGIYYLAADQTYLPEYFGVSGTLFVNGENNKLFFPMTGTTRSVSGQTTIEQIGEAGWYLSKCYEKINDDSWIISFLRLDCPDEDATGDWDPEVGYAELRITPNRNFYDDFYHMFYGYDEGFSIRAVNDVMSDPAQTAPSYNDGVNSGDGVKIAGFWWAPFNCTASESNPYVYFQWGRKFGQAKSLGNLTPTTMTKADDTEANKNKFGKSSNNWFEGVNNGLWRTGKGVGDPCPADWRVPTKAELEALAKHFSGFVDNGDLKGRWFSGDQTYSESGSRIFLPAAGKRDGNDGKVSEKDEVGYYWSLSFSGEEAYCLKFSESETPSVVSDYEGKRVNGYTVRCIHQY